MHTFAEYLRHQRLSRGLTMQALASHLGISPQFISLLESGNRRPSNKLLRRCAAFFNDDINYLTFLAQPIPEAQRRALYESPIAPEYIPRPLRTNVLVQDSEDLLLQNLMALPGLPEPMQDTPFYVTDIPKFPESAATTAVEVIARIKTDSGRFPLKAQAWVRFYEAFFKRVKAGRLAAAADFEALRQWMRVETTGTYPPKLRFLVAAQLGQIRLEQQKFDEARTFFEEAKQSAAEMSDPGAEASVCWSVAQAYRTEGDLFKMLEWLDTALAITDVPPFAIVRCRTDALEVLQLLHRNDETLKTVEDVVILWRSASLEAPQLFKSQSLFRSELTGLETCIRTGDDAEARRWLNRVRAIASRIPVPEIDESRLDLAASQLVLARGRSNQARMKLEALTRGFLPSDDAGRTVRDDIRIQLARIYLLIGETSKAESLIADMAHEPPMRTTLREVNRKTNVAIAHADVQLATERRGAALETLRTAELALNEAIENDPRLDATPLAFVIRNEIQERRQRASE
jgi:transcriptional regulator with XRE-family HTH domain